MKRIIAYGSLKKGLHNHWGVRNGKFMGETVITGTMFSVGGSYPVLMETGTNKFVGEVYEIPETDYTPIHNMEIGAGYIAKEIETKFGPAIVFYGEPNRRTDHLKEVMQWPPKD